ncbi:lipoprotein-releasing ABC transporter permease subunit LolE [Orbaceae bacterium ac157xtp]
MLAFFIANKFRKGRRKSGILSLISIISTLSVAIGIAALIIGLSAMNGFEKELNQRVLSLIPHGKIYTLSNKGILNWGDIQKDILSQPHVTSATPIIEFAGLLENGNYLKTVQVQGLDLEQEQKISVLANYILDQSWNDFTANKQQIIIGVGLANDLKVKKGDWVTLLIPISSDSTNQFKQPKRVRLNIAGIMDFSGDIGNGLVILPIQDAQKYNNLGDAVTSIKINFDDVYNANYLISQLALNLELPLSFSSWEENYGYMYHDIQMIRQIMYLAMVVVISVACFSIVSALVIAVKDKQRDIAILKTLGATNRLITMVFVFYGIISGFFGSLLGVILGVFISSQLSNISHLFEVIMGKKILNSHIYFIDFLPSEIHIKDILIVFLTTMLLSLIASYYPSKRACKVDPVKILNNF